MHSFKQIIENQNTYKDQILDFFISEMRNTNNELRKIVSNDEFILNEKQKLLKKFKKINTLDTIKKYFFINNKRDETYYVWWDISLQEALILTYGKK